MEFTNEWLEMLEIIGNRNGKISARQVRDLRHHFNRPFNRIPENKDERLPANVEVVYRNGRLVGGRIVNVVDEEK